MCAPMTENRTTQFMTVYVLGNCLLDRNPCEPAQNAAIKADSLQFPAHQNVPKLLIDEILLNVKNANSEWSSEIFSKYLQC